MTQTQITDQELETAAHAKEELDRAMGALSMLKHHVGRLALQRDVRDENRTSTSSADYAYGGETYRTVFALATEIAQMQDRLAEINSELGL